jgi:3-hydroxypropanoate dehydrogenase
VEVVAIRVALTCAGQFVGIDVGNSLVFDPRPGRARRFVMHSLDEAVWRQLFLDARTHNGWFDEAVDDGVLQRLYEILRMGPTGSNSQPLRILFVKTPAAKERLRPTLDAGNVEKTMRAPVTAILAWDSEFYEKMAKLVPHRPDTGQRLAALAPEVRRPMAELSATLQAGYFIIAARGLGLDCGPMGGFDKQRVDAEFFPDGKWRSLVLVNLGHGDPARLRPRAPRLDFAEACRIV